jgi:hypothetical protein
MLHVSNRDSEEDLWEMFQENNGNEWVVVRDHKVGLYYFGHILAYSDSEKKRELIMEEVSVFNEEGEPCYNVDRIYIGREFDDLTVEIYNKDTMIAEGDLNE